MKVQLQSEVLLFFLDNGNIVYQEEGEQFVFEKEELLEVIKEHIIFKGV